MSETKPIPLWKRSPYKRAWRVAVYTEEEEGAIVEFAFCREAIAICLELCKMGLNPKLYRLDDKGDGSFVAEFEAI